MKWALNDLKANRGIWAGVFLVLVVTQTILCAMSVCKGINDLKHDSPGEVGVVSHHLSTNVDSVYQIAMVLGCLVIMVTIQASIRQRRKGLALLSLLGATPRQVLTLTMVQVFVLTLISSIVGMALAPILAPRILKFQLEAVLLPPLITFTWQGFLDFALRGLAVGFIVALLGALFTLRALRKVLPVELLRGSGTEEVHVTRAGRGLRRFLIIGGFIALLAPAVAAVILVLNDPKTLSKTQLGIIMQPMSLGPIIAILLFLVALAYSGGPIIQWATKTWTNLVHVQSDVWKIARAQAIVRSRGKAFGSTIISLTACLFLLGGLLITGQTSTAAISGFPQLKDMGSATPIELMSSLWSALLIAVIGAVASFAISAKERNLDLALISIAGAVPGQLLAISALDGFILVTTGILISAGATLLVGVFTAVTFLPLSKNLFVVVFPWKFFIILAVPIIAAGTLSTFFSARSSLKRSAIETVQTAIGE